MKKYRCPYCGEQTLTPMQKFSGKRQIGLAPEAVNKAYFTCANCHHEVEHLSTKAGNKYYNMLVPLLLLSAALFLLATAMKWYPLVLVFIGLAVLIAFIMSFVRLKYDVFVRIGEHEDQLIQAKLSFAQKHVFEEEMICLLKPRDENLNKTGVFPCYVVAITSCNPEKGLYNLRFIKPDEHHKLVSSCTGFLLYDEEKKVAEGRFAENC